MRYRKHSLPGNHVIGICETCAAAGGSQCLVFTQRPRNHALCQGTRASAVVVPVWVRGDVVSVIAVDLYVVWPTPGIEVLTSAACCADAASWLGWVFHGGWRDKNDLSCVKRGCSRTRRICGNTRPKFIKQKVVCRVGGSACSDVDRCITIDVIACLRGRIPSVLRVVRIHRVNDLREIVLCLRSLGLILHGTKSGKEQTD